MNFASVYSERLQTVRTAIAASTNIARLTGEYPYFVHKWTKQKRIYTSTDLYVPECVFVRGNWPSWNSPVAGVGGTRSPTVETFCLVANVTRELAGLGIIVISGGVPGVDLAAHLATGDEPGGATVAVLANPVGMGLRGHEWFSAAVETQILKSGAFASEYAQPCEVGSDVFCERLLARGRIISGLCDIFLVFECSEDSATIDTARRALAQGKSVMCINSVRRSERKGVSQLADEFSLPVLDERKLSPRAIAKKILETLKYAAPK